MPVSDTLQSAQAFGPSIWFAVFIVMLVVVVGAAYVRYVHLPQQQATNDNNALLASAVSKLTEVMARTDERTAETHDAVGEINAVINAIAVAKSYEVEAIAKVAERAKVDVSRELASIAGLMKFVRQEYVQPEPVKP